MHSRTTLALAAGVVSLHPVNERHLVLSTTVRETVADLGLRIKGASRMGMQSWGLLMSTWTTMDALRSVVM